MLGRVSGISRVGQGLKSNIVVGGDLVVSVVLEIRLEALEEVVGSLALGRGLSSSALGGGGSLSRGLCKRATLAHGIRFKGNQTDQD